MSDWPLVISRSSLVITPFSPESIGTILASWALNPYSASGAWPTANLAIFIPFVLTRPTTIYQLGWFNGSAVSGNIDVGIYDAAFNRLTSTGSTAQAGTTAPQSVDITDIIIGPGLFWMAAVMDNTTGTLQRTTIGVAALCRATGMCEQATAFPLPATATPTLYTQNYVPGVGAWLRTLV